MERATSPNANAEYRLLQLPPGKYTIIVEAAGFGRLEARDQVVTVGQSRELPVVLKVAGGQTIVEVNAEAELVETTRSQTTTTIDQNGIDNLPINGQLHQLHLDGFADPPRQRPSHGCGAYLGAKHKRPARSLQPGQRGWRRCH
jgi:hypothetical protein